MSHDSAPSEAADITLSDLLDRHRAALGGLEALTATTCYEEEAEITGASPHRHRALVDQASQRLRVHAEVPTLGITLDQGFDGRLAWEKGPSFDGYHPAGHPLTLRFLGQLPPLWRTDLPADGPAAPRLVGVLPDGSGHRCYVVERHERNEAGQLIPVRDYISTADHLTREQRRGAEEDEVSRFEDYRLVEGRLFPFRAVQHGRMGDHVSTVRALRIAHPRDEDFRHPTAHPAADGDGSGNPDLASFDAVLATVENVHFDPSFGGLDLKEVRARYRPRAEALPGTGGREFVEVVTRMLAELKATHYAITPRDLVRSGEAREQRPGRLGLGLRWVEGAATVNDLSPDSPASRSVLRPGFVITHLNGRDHDELHRVHAPAVGHTVNPDSAQVAPYGHELRVQAGEAVRVGYLDGAGAPGEVTLVADAQDVQQKPYFTSRREGGTLVVSFKLFVGSVVERFAAALRENAEARSLVVDLRGNPGGIAQMPPMLASHLMREKATLGRFIYRTQATVMEAPGQPDAFLGPVAVLVDTASGSCSELLAQALQEMGRARVFGRRSAGAVLPSTWLLLPNGCEFQHAICDYRTPKGTRVEGVGVVPDEIVELRRADLLDGVDRDLQAALAWLRTQSA